VNYKFTIPFLPEPTQYQPKKLIELANTQLQQIALLLNTRRDVALLRLYRLLGFTHVPPKE
jgi:hypothetical protein